MHYTELVAKYIIKIFYTENQEKAKEILLNYIQVNSTSLQSAGFVKGCFLATFEDTRDSIHLIIISYEKREFVVNAVWTLLRNIVTISSHVEEMDSLYTNRKLMFEQIDSSESSTQIWINKILAKMRKPVDEIKPDDLENILRVITIQFSRLSTLASSIRRDQVKVEGLDRSLNNLLKKWNEKPMDYHQTTSLVEIEHFENLKAKFRDFLERVEALMAQLDILLDSVRTYLGIKQQKLSIIEQLQVKAHVPK